MPVPLYELISIEPTYAAIAIIGLFSGANAPDYLECKLINHRTITHTLSIWLAVALFGLQLAQSMPPAQWPNLTANSGEFGSLLFGFGCGGVAHWIGDVFNHHSIPVLTPFDKVSFGLYRSGEGQALTCSFIILLAWLIVFLRSVN